MTRMKDVLEKAEASIAVDQATQEILVQTMLDAYIRGLKLQLRQLSKKQLVAMVVNLAVRLYKLENQK